MDFDVDLVSDDITQFLNRKLEEIKYKNRELEESVETRKKISEKSNGKIHKETQDQIQIEGFWKRIFNNKYVLAWALHSESDLNFTDPSIILDWNCDQKLMFKSHLIATNSDHTLLPAGLEVKNSFKQNALLIISLEVPSFTDKLKYKIYGLMTFQVNNKKLILKIPSHIPLNCEDSTDKVIGNPQATSIIEGNFENFITFAFASEKFELCMIFSENSRQLLETIFEVDCSFYRVNPQLSWSKMFYLAHKLSGSFDTTILEVQESDENNSGNLVIYTRDETSLIQILHYFYRQTSEIVFIPRKSAIKEDFISNRNLVSEFKNAIFKEIDFLKQNFGSTKPDFEGELLSYELLTDLLFSKIKNKTF